MSRAISKLYIFMPDDHNILQSCCQKGLLVKHSQPQQYRSSLHNITQNAVTSLLKTEKPEGQTSSSNDYQNREMQSLISSLGTKETLDVLKRRISQTSDMLLCSSISNASSFTSLDSGFSDGKESSFEQSVKKVKKFTIDTLGRRQYYPRNSLQGINNKGFKKLNMSSVSIKKDMISMDQ